MTNECIFNIPKVQICDVDVDSSLSNVYENLGYCPQHDALWKNITVEEHVRCYAEVRGIHEDQIDRYDKLL